MQIIVQARDKFGNARNTGGDKFEATVEGGSKPKATVDDRRDGTYVVSFVPGWAADYEVSTWHDIFSLSLYISISIDCNKHLIHSLRTDIRLGPAKIEGMPIFVAAK